MKWRSISSDSHYFTTVTSSEMNLGSFILSVPTCSPMVELVKGPTFHFMFTVWSKCVSVHRLRDRVTIKTGPRHIVRETEDTAFEMIIKSAQKSDTGVYTCKIINEYGTKQCEAKLEVNGKDAPPLPLSIALCMLQLVSLEV